MKKITLLTLATLLVFSKLILAQETCVADPTRLYYTTNAGWTQSEWFPIINIDAELLDNQSTGLSTHSGADGSVTSSTFSSGTFTTPVYEVDANLNPVPTSLRWPVNFYMACLNNSFFNSSYTKVNVLGTNPSGSGVNDAPCYNNNNSVIQSPIWAKKGFIELSRMASAVANTPPSRHGFIEINDLPQVERVQWSYSSTAWRRGVKLDIKHGDGPWQPLRWVPSDMGNSQGSFSEQGYAFEEIIGKQEDPTSKISLRWRIWDGDSIHVNPTSPAGATFTVNHFPFASRQVARIHQIRIFSGIIPLSAPSSVSNPSAMFLQIYRSGDHIVLSEIAQVEVYTLSGKKMFAGKTNLIQARHFAKGVYLVKATDANGKVQNQKILF